MFWFIAFLACGGGLFGLGMANEYYYGSGMDKIFLPPSTWSDDTFVNEGGCSSCFSGYDDDEYSIF